MPSKNSWPLSNHSRKDARYPLKVYKVWMVRQFGVKLDPLINVKEPLIDNVPTVRTVRATLLRPFPVPQKEEENEESAEKYPRMIETSTDSGFARTPINLDVTKADLAIAFQVPSLTSSSVSKYDLFEEDLEDQDDRIERSIRTTAAATAWQISTVEEDLKLLVKKEAMYLNEDLVRKMTKMEKRIQEHFERRMENTGSRLVEILEEDAVGKMWQVVKEVVKEEMQGWYFTFEVRQSVPEKDARNLAGSPLTRRLFSDVEDDVFK